MERNTAEIGRTSEPTPTQSSSRSKNKSSFSTHQIDNDSSGEEQNPITVHSTSSTPMQGKPKQWTYPQGLKFPCPIGNHKHEMTACSEYFAYSPVERWAKIDRLRICYCCLKPKSLCQPRRWSNEATVPTVLKCSVCAESATTKGLAPFSILYCKRKEHGQTRAPLSEIKANLDKY